MKNVRLLHISDIARAAILKARRPISSREILEFAINSKLPVFAGKTPRHSIQAAIWKHIRKHKDSPFVMVGSGRVHRKYWLKKTALAGPRNLKIKKVDGYLRATWH
jgi:hypothetical protein